MTTTRVGFGASPCPTAVPSRPPLLGRNADAKGHCIFDPLTAASRSEVRRCNGHMVVGISTKNWGHAVGGAWEEEPTIRMAGVTGRGVDR